jgi:hypothetical protein
MSFKSKAQARLMFKKYPAMAKEWADKTPSFRDLPERVKPTKKQQALDTLKRGMRGENK